MARGDAFNFAAVTGVQYAAVRPLTLCMKGLAMLVVMCCLRGWQEVAGLQCLLASALLQQIMPEARMEGAQECLLHRMVLTSAQKIRRQFI